MRSSAIVLMSVVEECSKGRRRQKQNSETRVRKVLRQDLYRPPRLPSAACGWRLLTVAVWRRLHAPTDEGIAARRPETQNSVTGVRDANGRTLLDALQGVLQRKFFTICRRSAL